MLFRSDAARRILQAGPFELAPGAYALETSIATREQVVLGTNRWDFTVTAASDRRAS